MPKFSQKSLDKLNSCDERLQKLFKEVIKSFDCTIVCGYRGEEDQNDAFEKGYSKLKYPNSKHNKQPSLAVDVVPYPINYNDRVRMCFFSGFVKGIALMLGIKIRLGADWNRNTILSDETFPDLPHFEIDD